MDDAEAAIELLKQLGAPKDDSGAGLLDMLKDMTDKLRAEFDQKL